MTVKVLYKLKRSYHELFEKLFSSALNNLFALLIIFPQPIGNIRQILLEVPYLVRTWGVLYRDMRRRGLRIAPRNVNNELPRKVRAITDSTQRLSKLAKPNHLKKRRSQWKISSYTQRFLKQCLKYCQPSYGTFPKGEENKCVTPQRSTLNAKACPITPLAENGRTFCHYRVNNPGLSISCVPQSNESFRIDGFRN